jgi:hypothetical protein
LKIKKSRRGGILPAARSIGIGVGIGIGHDNDYDYDNEYEYDYDYDNDSDSDNGKKDSCHFPLFMSRMLMPQSTCHYFNPNSILINEVGQPCPPGGIWILSLTGASRSSYNVSADQLTQPGSSVYREQGHAVYC